MPKAPPARKVAPAEKITVTKTTPKSSNAKKGGNVWDRVSDIEVGTGIKINIYGRSGSGKTTFWATFPGKILVLVCSGGEKPGELRSINTPEYRKKIKTVVLESSLEVQQMASWLKANPDEYSTVVLDHATGLQDLNLKEILKLDQLPAQLSWGLATQQQYGQLALQMKEHLRSLLDLPQNVVIVAQEREFNTESSDSLLMPYVASALSPSIVGWLNPACDYICQTFIRPKFEEVKNKIGDKEIITKKATNKVEFCLRTAPSSVYTTKFRAPKGIELPDDIVDPDYTKLMEIIGDS
jgi:hypothetical protein